MRGLENRGSSGSESDTPGSAAPGRTRAARGRSDSRDPVAVTSPMPPPASCTADSSGENHTNRLLVAIAAVFVVLQAAVTALGTYGYFIDEFYYIACARRLALGYVDHPPLAPLVLAVVRAIAGESLLAIRFPAFLCGGLIVWATGRMVREFGGGRWAALGGALTAALAPGVLAVTGFFSVNAFEAVAWVLCTWALVRLLRTGDTRLWMLVGLAVGLGFESKHTVATLVVGVGAGFMATRQRALLWNRWALLGGALAFAIALPNVLWQVANGFPSLEFYRNAATLKNLPSPPLHTIVEQLRFMGLFTSPVWLTALGWCLFTREGGRWRPIAVAYVVLLVLLVVSQQSRPDRLIGIYPVLIGAGLTVVERHLRWRAGRALVIALLVAGCLPGMPIVIGVLPPPVLTRYVAWLGLQTSGERGKTSPIPQLLADRTGWEAFVDQIAALYRALPPQDQRRTLIYAPSYGQAGAIDVLGRNVRPAAHDRPPEQLLALERARGRELGRAHRGRCQPGAPAGALPRGDGGGRDELRLLHELAERESPSRGPRQHPAAQHDVGAGATTTTEASPAPAPASRASPRPARWVVASGADTSHACQESARPARAGEVTGTSA